MEIVRYQRCPVCFKFIRTEVDCDSFTGQVWEESSECPTGHYSYNMHYSHPIELIGGINCIGMTVVQTKEQIKITREKIGWIE